MTREQRMIEAAKLDENFFIDKNFDCFLRAVEWADENPKEGLVSLDKVCEILKTNIDKYTTIKTHGCYGERFWQEIVMTQKGIEDFRKAMEE